MAAQKVAISIDQKLLEELDGLVMENVFPNRSQAIQAAVQEKLARMRGGHYKPAAPGRVSPHLGNPERRTSQAVVGEDFSDSHPVGGSARQETWPGLARGIDAGHRRPVGDRGGLTPHRACSARRRRHIT